MVRRPTRQAFTRSPAYLVIHVRIFEKFVPLFYAHSRLSASVLELAIVSMHGFQNAVFLPEHIIHSLAATQSRKRRHWANELADVDVLSYQ